jgi:hypothetical protein
MKNVPFYLRQGPNPKNDPALLLPGFETEEHAEERYAARGRLMFTGNSVSEPNFYWCEPGWPCNSGACPKCMRQFRRWWVDAAISLLDQQSSPVCVASLVHHTLCRTSGRLYEFDLAKAKRQLARHVERAGLGDLIAIGGFDFCFCIPVAPASPYWQPHAYVVFQGIKKGPLKQALSPFYPKAPNIPRPIRTRDVMHLMGAVSYSIKAVFYKRISYTDDRGRANTRPLPLSCKDREHELLSYLDGLRAVDRVFLRNARRESDILIRTR